jgi:tetratricopeptide (TPR) repeat protein
MNLGILLGLTNKPNASFRCFDTAAATYAAMGNRRGRALVLSNAAWMRHAVLGDDVQAESDIKEALGVYDEIGDVRGKAQCLGTLGCLRCTAGRTEEGFALLQESLDTAHDAGDFWIASQVLKEFARCELEAGFPDRALAHTESALNMCSDVGMSDLAVSVKALRSRLFLAVGQPAEALAMAAEALRSLRPGMEQAHLVPYAYALALSAHDQHDEADRYFQLAHDQLLRALGDLPPPDRDAALAAVPAHREIIDTWARRRPQCIERRLASRGAPTGRPLAPHEWVSVNWTIHLSADDAITDPVARRRECLQRLLAEAAAQGGAPTVDDLAGALGASVATIRRDLAALRRSGRPAPTRGARHGQTG